MQYSPHTCSWNTETWRKSSRANSRATLYRFRNVVDVSVQVKHEHWEGYNIRAMYWIPWKTLNDPEFCTQETVDGVPQQQQWHYRRRSRKLYISIFGFVKMCGIFHSTPSMSLSTATTANWRFRHWLSTAGVKDNIGYQIQTTVQWSSSPSETVRNVTHVHTHFA
jgi:hypothetical protein